MEKLSKFLSLLFPVEDTGAVPTAVQFFPVNRVGLGVRGTV